MSTLVGVFLVCREPAILPILDNAPYLGVFPPLLVLLWRTGLSLAGSNAVCSSYSSLPASFIDRDVLNRGASGREGGSAWG